MEVYNNCYCCPKPSILNTNQAAMNLDSALNELGMLSTVTDSRMQFLREKERDQRRSLLGPRGRNLSEPSIAGAGTPSNSPTKGPYHVVQLNPEFVTSLSTGLAGLASNCPSTTSNPSYSCFLKPDPVNSTACTHLNFGEKYMQSEVERNARVNRITQLKRRRITRFHKPYELPWRQTLEHTYNSNIPIATTSTSLIYNVNNQGQYSSVAAPFLGITPEKSRPADNVCSSNLSTPEKNSRSSQNSTLPCTVTRSKSLDDLDITKLRLVEVDNDFVQERKDIDTVSEHLSSLHVQE